jgi:hypothetical protein
MIGGLDMKFKNHFLWWIPFILCSCAHAKPDAVSAAEAARIDRKLVRDSVVYDPGAKDGAVVPDISSPQLRAIIVEERVEGNRLIERHREWILEGDVSLLGIPAAARKTK